MKIVFLDGVFNSSDFLYRDGVPFSSTSADEKIDPEAQDDWRWGIDKFVILDDDNDMGSLSDHLVKTTSAHGLQDEHVAKAIEILGEK